MSVKLKFPVCLITLITQSSGMPVIHFITHIEHPMAEHLKHDRLSARCLIVNFKIAVCSKFLEGFLMAFCYFYKTSRLLQSWREIDSKIS